jgi:hypothetical protein
MNMCAKQSNDRFEAQKRMRTRVVKDDEITERSRGKAANLRYGCKKKLRWLKIAATSS